MTAPAPSRLVVAAVIACLEGAGLEVGNGVTPADTTGAYAIVHPITAVIDGPIGNPHADSREVVQVDYWGHGPEQADWARDLGRFVITPRAALAVAGYSANYVEVEGDARVREDDTAGAPLWRAHDDYRIHLSPA